MRNRILTVLGVIFVIGLVLYFLGFQSTKLHISVVAEPLWCIGGVRESPEKCASGFPFTNGLLTTIVVVLIWVGLGLTLRNMQMVPRGIQNILEVLVETFYNFVQSVDRKNVQKFFPFCASAFFFMWIANTIGLVPGVGSIGSCVPTHHEAAIVAPAPDVAVVAAEEAPAPTIYDNWPLSCPKDTLLVPYFRAPSADLNMTLAWALVSVFLIQYFGFQALGLGYLGKFFNFKEGFMGAFVGILELLSEFIRIISFAFRLFGNIFAGEVILVVMAFLFPYLLPMPFYLFELFVTFLQAVIFSVLSVVFMSIATQAHGGHDEKHDEHAAAH